MKKFLSILCALAVAAALAVPAFAQDTATPGEVDENATPGEVVEDYTEQLLANPTNSALAKQIVDMVNSNTAINVDAKTSSAMVNAISTNGIVLGGNWGVQAMIYRGDSAAQGMKLTGESIKVEGNRVKVSASFVDANGKEVQPMLGASIVVRVDDKVANKDMVLVDENNRMIDSVTVFDNGFFSSITFWAPHFSTYTIMPRSEYEPTVPPTTEPTTPPTTEPTTPPTGSTGEDDQPIKATGADMSLAVVAVLAVAGVVIGGGALAAKKNGAR